MAGILSVSPLRTSPPSLSVLLLTIFLPEKAHDPFSLGKPNSFPEFLAAGRAPFIYCPFRSLFEHPSSTEAVFIFFMFQSNTDHLRGTIADFFLEVIQTLKKLMVFLLSISFD